MHVAPEMLDELRPQLERGFRPDRPGGRGLRARLLAVPLIWKLVGANALILFAAAASVLVARASGTTHQVGITILASALGLTFIVTVVLVTIALRPLEALEDTASRVWRGDLGARVRPSALADRDMLRIGEILNLLLDGLTGDRARMRLLASQIIRAQDEERARVARELHDSVAQSLAAAMLQIRATTVRSDDPQLAAQLDTLRQIVSDALEEVRSLSHTMYPRVLDDLGLVAALEWLARQTRELTGVRVDVEEAVEGREIPPAVASVLYRVAQEALRNAVTHAECKAVRLWVSADLESATLEVVDDGKGFDVAAAEARRPGMGLFSIHERVSLVNGTVEIHSVKGRGTRVTATVPIDGRGQ